MTKITVNESLANGLRNRFFEEMTRSIQALSRRHLSKKGTKSNREGFHKSYIDLKKLFENVLLVSYDGGSKKKPYVAFQVLNVVEGKEYNTWNERCLTGFTFLVNFEPYFVDDNDAVFNISEHAIARLYLRTEPKVINNLIDWSYIVEEMRMLPFWSNYWAMTLYGGMSPFGNKNFDLRGFVFPAMPGSSGLFFSEFTNMSKYIEVRTFVDDNHLTFEQSKAKALQIEVAKDVLASPICFFLSVGSLAIDNLTLLHQVITNRILEHRSYSYLRNVFFHKVEDDNARNLHKLEFDKLMKSYVTSPDVQKIDDGLTVLGVKQFQLEARKASIRV
ncbi:MAG: hypothetical protein EBU08_15605 [Micrococcales bacterium]|nr:hypothetical protein [Micrococcales bacterium]